MVKPNKAVPTGDVANLPLLTDEIFKIKINTDTQKFYIDEQEDYGQFDQFSFRVLDSVSKLVAYTTDFEVKNETVFFRTPAEAFDAQGGVGCGRKLFKSETVGLSEDQVKANKDKAKWYTFIMGIATVPGKSPLLCDLRVGGGSQIDLNNILKKIKGDKKELNKAELNIKATRNEEFDWPKLEFMADFYRSLPVTGLSPLFDTIGAYIDEHNSKIMTKAEKYKKFGPWKGGKGKSSPKAKDVPF